MSVISQRFAIQLLYLLLLKASVVLNLRHGNETYLGDGNLRQELKLTRHQSPSSILLLTDMRYDGAGAEIREMIFYAAYAARRKWKYIGAVRHPPLIGHDQHKQNIPGLADFIFGRPVVFAYSEGLSLREMDASTNVRMVEVIYNIKMHGFTGVTGEQVLPRRIVVDSLQEIWGNQLLRDEKANAVWIRESNSIEYLRLCEREKVSPPKISLLDNSYFGASHKNTKLDSNYSSAVDLEIIDTALNGSEQLELQSIVVLDNVLTEAFTNEMRGLILHNAAKAAVEGSDHVQLLFAPQRLSVALHLRRGRDVSVSFNSNRYTPNEYYYNLVARIRVVHPDADVHVFSSLENHTKPSSFDGFRARGMQVHFEDTVGVKQAWINMMEARILITAKSSFSFVPALFNPHCVIFEAMGNVLKLGKMRSWITEVDMTEEYLRSC